jgi:hypothetical protein
VAEPRFVGSVVDAGSCVSHVRQVLGNLSTAGDLPIVQKLSVDVPADSDVIRGDCE